MWLRRMAGIIELMPDVTHLMVEVVGDVVVVLYYHRKAQAALLSNIYSQGTDPRENTFSERSPTKHALLYRV
jgi:hypothetical protein